MKLINIFFIPVLLLIMHNSVAQTSPTKQQTVTELNNLKIGSAVKHIAYVSRYGEEIWKDFNTYKFLLTKIMIVY